MCGLERYPGVYARVTYYKKWINKKVKVQSMLFFVKMEMTLYSVTCQLLVEFSAVFDQFSGRFSKEDNSVGFKIF